jgi:serine/threonine protein kinase
MSGKNKEGRDPDSGNTARGDDTPPDNDETVETNASSKSDPELIRGKVLGDKYEILAHLGSGAMGVVYKARHLILNKEVAIKVLQSQALNDRVKKERFMREAKAQGGLSHRNIAAVHDFGLTDKEQPFFVMDLLKGETLEDYLERVKSLPCVEACQIFEQVARALQHAHSKGIVHRDLKPSNIMLVESEDGDRQALLVDFGIAVFKEKELTKLTKADFVLGTPLYMSPEQIKGKDLDARSDIYSLGCVMFETLTGNLPFSGINEQATMAMHLVQPPEQITSFKTKTPLPNELAQLIMRCIEKQPENRYGSAKEVASLLNDIKPLAERALKEQLEDAKIRDNESDSKSKNDSDLVGSAKGHLQNPAHAPHAVVEEGEAISAKVVEKIPEQVQLKEQDDASSASFKSVSSSPDERKGNTNDTSSKSTLVIDEADRLSSKISHDTETHENSASTSNNTKQNSGDATKPIPVTQPPTTAKEPADFSVSGHDVIRLVAVIATLIVFEPLNGRLILPIDPKEMRDDNLFFMAAKYLVELNSYLAHNPVYQWVVPVLLAVLVYNIVNKLLENADK